ncbi:MAG: HEPN domain-containing protein [Gammaproteobacteria bacterium]|nr:HEPN domain-containing protein [Gammaproteobacteria bacterium]MYG12676.1 HEPN domain-containing protein [Gammaproteobacteria bacterium]MYK29094.1 HEPN domain-containing protein [Gammaproteobacteria bacterium]
MANPHDERMKTAMRRLESARYLRDGKYYDDAVGRAYYAVYEAAHAALGVSGIPQPKTHSGLASQFNRHCVLSGRMPQEVATALGGLEDERSAADYFRAVPSAEEADEAIRKAENFVNTVRREYFPPM